MPRLHALTSSDKRTALRSITHLTDTGRHVFGGAYDDIADCAQGGGGGVAVHLVSSP